MEVKHMGRRERIEVENTGRKGKMSGLEKYGKKGRRSVSGKYRKKGEKKWKWKIWEEENEWKWKIWEERGDGMEV